MEFRGCNLVMFCLATNCKIAVANKTLQCVLDESFLTTSLHMDSLSDFSRLDKLIQVPWTHFSEESSDTLFEGNDGNYRALTLQSNTAFRFTAHENHESRNGASASLSQFPASANYSSVDEDEEVAFHSLMEAVIGSKGTGTGDDDNHHHHHHQGMSLVFTFPVATAVEDSAATATRHAERILSFSLRNISSLYRSLNIFLLVYFLSAFLSVLPNERTNGQVCVSALTTSTQRLLLLEQRFSVDRDRKQRHYSGRYDDQSSTTTQLSSARRAVGEIRAERDLWTLASSLCRADLMKTIDCSLCANALESITNSSMCTSNIRDVLIDAVKADDRMRKLKEIKEWLERAAEDLVELLPPPPASTSSETSSSTGKGMASSGYYPWRRTLDMLLDDDKQQRHWSSPSPSSRSRSRDGGLSSVDPDAQFVHSGSHSSGVMPMSMLFVPLEEQDESDQQERILKSLWWLIRSGQLLRAQVAAVEHGLHWLAASLIGVSLDYVMETRDGTDDGNGVDGDGNGNGIGTFVRDNANRAMWLRSVWEHVQMLSGYGSGCGLVDGTFHRVGDVFPSPSQSSRSGRSGRSGYCLSPKALLTSLLEMSIYAALSSHWEVLRTSPLISEGSWSDRLWAAVKTCLDYRVGAIVLQHRRNKLNESGLYHGVSESDVSMEQELLCDVGRATILDNNSNDNSNNMYPDDDSLIDDMGLILLKCPPTPTLTSSPFDVPSVEEIVLRLQAALIDGPVAFAQLLTSILTDPDPVVTVLHGVPYDTQRSSTSANPRLLRLLAHLSLWLSYSASMNSTMSSLNQVFPYDSFRIAILAYVNNLCETSSTATTSTTSTGSGSPRHRHRVLTAAYIAHLNREDRIAAFVRVLQSFGTTSTTTPTSSNNRDYWNFWNRTAMEREQVLETAMYYFPEGRSVGRSVDVLSILRNVISRDRAVLLTLVTGRRAGGGVEATGAGFRWSSSSPPVSSVDTLRGRTGTGRGLGLGLQDVTSASSGPVSSGGSEERSLMSSLLWLCIYPTHRLEAVTQSLLFARELLLAHTTDNDVFVISDMSLLLERLKYLFRTLLPADSIKVVLESGYVQGCGYGYPRDILPNQEDTDLRSSLASSMCLAEVEELLCWLRVERAFSDIAVYGDALAQLRQTASVTFGNKQAASLSLDGLRRKLLVAAKKALGTRSINRYIDRTINRCPVTFFPTFPPSSHSLPSHISLTFTLTLTDSIMDVLYCTRNLDPNLDHEFMNAMTNKSNCGGISEVFVYTETLQLRQCRALFRQDKQRIVRLEQLCKQWSAEGCGMGSSSSSGGSGGVPKCAAAKMLLSADNDDNVSMSASISLLSSLRAVLDELSPGNTDIEVEAAARNGNWNWKSRVLDLLHCIEKGRQVLSALSGALLHQYQQICLSTAEHDVQTVVAGSGSGSVPGGSYFLHRAVSIADVLADRNPALNLRTVVRSDVLRSILAGAQKAALGVMAANHGELAL
eukprot:gene4097-8146_t